MISLSITKKFVLVAALLFFWFSLFQGSALIEQFQDAADSVVIDALLLKGKGEYTFGGFLVRGDYYRATNTERESPIPSAYLSRYGFQFRIFDVLWPRTLALETYAAALRFLMALLLAATLSLFIFVMRKEFGLLPALGVCIGILSSPWLVLYSGSITWAIFASFLPFVFVWAFYRHLRPKFLLLCLAIGGLIFFKALFGYEYLPNIVLSTLVPLLYYELRDKSSWFAIAKKSAAVFISGVVGFLAVLGLHIYQGAVYLGSVSAIIAHLAGKRVERATVDLSGMPHIVLDYLVGPAYLKTSVFTQVFFSLVYLWTMGIFFFGVIFLAFFWLKYHKNIRAYPSSQLNSLFFATILSYLATLSWAVLMPEGMAMHPQMAAMIFYLPANLMVAIFFFFAVTKLWHERT